MNLTSDHVPRLVRVLAVPASVGFFFSTLFNVVDTWWAGRISTHAQAALSLSFPVFFILIAAGSGLSQGSTALIASALGAGNTARARHYVVQSAILGILAGLAITVVGLIAAPSLFRLLGATEDYLGLSLAYMNSILLGGVFFLLQSVLNGGLQAQGDTRTFRNVLMVGCLANMALDPWFLYGGLGLPPMGISGIAAATVVITAVGAVLVGLQLRRSPLGSQIVAADLRPCPIAFREIAVQGLPASLNMMTVALGTFVITWFASRFSEKTVAAYGIATRIEQILLLPTIGLNIATLTLSGQNFGAGRPARVQEAWRTAIRYGLTLMTACGVLLFAFAGPLMECFSSDPEVVDTGRTYLHFAALTIGSYVVVHQTVFMLQGLRRPMFGLAIGLFRQVLAPAALFPWLSFHLALGTSGLWTGIFLINWSAALVAWLHGRRVLGHLMEEREKDSHDRVA